jgi:hypothetical protein
MGKHLLQLVGALSTSLKIDKFILEGDSSLVVSALQNLTLVIDWHIENVINDTISSFAASSLWETKKINRSANFCAYYVVYRATARVFPDCILSLVSPPTLFPYVVEKIYLPISSLLRLLLMLVWFGCSMKWLVTKKKKKKKKKKENSPPK